MCWFLKLCCDRSRTEMHPGKVHCKQHKSEGRRGGFYGQSQEDQTVRSGCCCHGVWWGRAGMFVKYMVTSILWSFLIFGIWDCMSYWLIQYTDHVILSFLDSYFANRRFCTCRIISHFGNTGVFLFSSSRKLLLLWLWKIYVVSRSLDIASFV